MDFLKSTAAVFIGLCLFFGTCISALIVFVLMVAVFSAGTRNMASHSRGGILVVNLSNPIVESSSEASAFARLNRIPDSIGLYEATARIRAAAKDNLILGVLVCGSTSSGAGETSLSAVSEVRRELESFKASGKPVFAYLENPNLADYYLASCANEIILNPEGEFSLKGLYAGGIYLKGALEKCGVGVQVVKAGKFKNYADMFLSDKMSAEDKSHMKEILDFLWGKIVGEISKSRGISVADLNRIALEEGIFSAKRALSLRLADFLLPKDEVISRLSEVAGFSGIIESFNQCSILDYGKGGKTDSIFAKRGGNLNETALPKTCNLGMESAAKGISEKPVLQADLSQADMGEAAKEEPSFDVAKSEVDPQPERINAQLAKNRYSKLKSRVRRDAIAVVYLKGEIYDSSSDRNGISAVDASALLRSLRLDANIKAVVLRVDSPGGSAFGSELIRREVELLTKEKPVVASFGSVAASGAYWFSAPASEIFCDDLSIVGSIGVFGLMFNVEKLAGSFGVAFDGVGTSPLADIYNFSRPKTPRQIEILQKRVDEVYSQFIEIVSTGRKLDKAHVKTLADGRVHDAGKALELGLVDKIGGLYQAMECAAKLGGLTYGCPIEVYPRPRTLEMIFIDAFAEFSAPFAKSADLGNPRMLLKRVKSLCGKDGVCARMPLMLEIN